MKFLTFGTYVVNSERPNVHTNILNWLLTSPYNIDKIFCSASKLYNFCFVVYNKSVLECIELYMV